MSTTLENANSASVAIIDGDKVLLIQRAYAPYQHLWTLPGGRRDPGETTEACAIREIGEELGLAIAEPKLALIQTLGQDKAWTLAVFATRIFSGTMMPSDEIADLRWVGLDEIGTLRTTARLDRVIERAFAVLPER